MKYETTIGLEVHVQLATRSKAFCGCSTEFGQLPNSQTCPVCLGLPGALPVLNKEALTFCLKVALALNCQISKTIKFDRKNYFYPDLPKNFQISQYDMPLSFDGHLDIEVDGKPKRIEIRRVHLEEDTGKLVHKEDASLVDFNRAGMPLLEIVSEPAINSPDEAYEYLVRLKAVLEYLDISDCDMEKGSLRCDANISARPKGREKLGTKTEIKNMNSFKAVRSALEFEARRQSSILSEGDEVAQETRLWDEGRQRTESMRTKEEAHDYRYFPEPDLVPFIIEEEEIERARRGLPELPHQRCSRLARDYGITDYDSRVLTSEKSLADYFEECVKMYPRPKSVANWMMGEVMAQMNERRLSIRELNLPPEHLVAMLKMIDGHTISGKMAKDILPKMIETGLEPGKIVEEEGLAQVSDREALSRFVDEVVKEFSKPAQDYKRGKNEALSFLVGQVMKHTRGRANPKLVNEILREKLTANE